MFAVIGFAVLILLANVLYRFWLNSFVPELYQAGIDRLLPQVSIVAAAGPAAVAAGLWLYRYLGAYFPSDSRRAFFWSLIVIDIIFLLLHISQIKIGWPATSAFRIDVDRGYAEIYQYVKEFFVASMLMILAFRHRQAVLVAWSVFFGFLLLDDSFRLHERLGTLIGKIVDLEPYIGVERQVYGEVLASTLFGATLLIPLMALAFLGRQNQLTKCANATLIYLTICLVFFGVFIDAFKNFLPSLGFLFDLIEDGGEMIVVSAIAWFVHVLSSEPESISTVSRGESLRPLS